VVNLGCGMATNSRATQAVTAQGSSSVLASPIAAVGGLSHSSNFRAGTELHAYSAVQEDPLASLANPIIPAGACPPVLVEPNETQTISPGCYSSMILKGNVTLQPGTYVIDAGSLQATSQSVISGSGVTLILTSRTADTNPSSIGTLTIDAGAKLNLTAPTSGPYSGILVYQDRRAPLLNTNTVSGHASGQLEGRIYMPRAIVTMAGSAGMSTECLQIVGRRLHFTGNNAVQNNCSTSPTSGSFAINYVRLVA
jgi:hypothetical protein